MTRPWQIYWHAVLSAGLCLAGVGYAARSGAEPLVLVRPHGENIQYDSDDRTQFFNKGSLTEQFTASGITFNVSYADVGVGFTDPNTGPALRARLEEVLSYVAGEINFTNRSLDIQVEASEFDGTGALATAGTFYPGTPGIHAGSTLQRLETGVKPFVGFPEITMTIDLGFPWNVSDALPADDEPDFFSVLLHEVTHGLGFASVIEPDGSSALGNDNYTRYDALLFDGDLDRLLLTDSIPPLFQGDGFSLTGGGLEFDGGEAFANYDTGDRVPVFSPNPIQPGSSLSHWDVTRLVGGAVMTHSITLGTIQREYAPADRGALVDLGYDRAAPVPGGGCALAKGGTAENSGANTGAFVVLVATGAALMRRTGNRQKTLK
jgi:hypothetical protein